jgi:hypothetical protein
MAENASLFLSYSELQHIIRRTTGQPLSQDLSLPQLALAAAGAGAITSFVLSVYCVTLASEMTLIPSQNTNRTGQM